MSRSRSRSRKRGRARGAGGGVVPILPGLLHRYLHPTLAGWPDEVGGVDGVHTGAPSIVSGSPDGVEYDGATQYTTVGNAATLPVHQTWDFSWSIWFRWAGPAAGTGLEALIANALGAATRGASIFIDDGAGGLGPRMLSAQLVRGVAPQITRLDSDPNAITVDQLHHALLTCDGATARLRLDGVVVASAAPIATQTGDATYATRIGDTEAGTPLFRFAGEIYDVALGDEDWSPYAEQIHNEGPGGFG